MGVLLGTEVVHRPTSTSVYHCAAVTYVVCRDALYVPAVYSGFGRAWLLGETKPRNLFHLRVFAPHTDGGVLLSFGWSIV